MGFTSKKRINAVITEEIMNLAVQQDSGHCLVADAFKAALPTMVRWNVDLGTIRFTDPSTGKRYIYLTPQLCQRILIDFEHGRLCPVGTQINISTPAQIVSRSAKERDRERERDKEPERYQKRAEAHRRSRARVKMIGTQPVKIGGSTPPLAVLSSGGGGRGRRRRFGVRFTDVEYIEPEAS